MNALEKANQILANLEPMPKDYAPVIIPNNLEDALTLGEFKEIVELANKYKGNGLIHRDCTIMEMLDHALYEAQIDLYYADSKLAWNDSKGITLGEDVQWKNRAERRFGTILRGIARRTNKYIDSKLGA